MDFSKLLNIASKKQKVIENVTTAPKRYDTSVPPPTKETRKKPAGVQSAAVRAFLEKKEKEKKQKELGEKRQAKKCMQQYIDSKKHVKAKNAKSPVQTKPAQFQIPKVSKDSLNSSEKSVSRSDSCKAAKISTKLVHPSQRKSNAETHSKTPIATSVGKEKQANPNKSLSSSLNVSRGSAKNASKPASNERNSARESGKQHVKNMKPVVSEVRKPTAKRPLNSSGAGMGPMAFADILKLAQDKNKNTDNSDNGAKKNSKVFDRPMTQEEKERLARKQTKEYQDWYKYGPSAAKKGSAGSSVDSKTKVAPGKASKSTPEPKLSGAASILKKTLSGEKPNRSIPTPSPSKPRNAVNSVPPGGRLMQSQVVRREPKYAETRDNVLVCRPVKEEEEEDANLSAWDRIYKKMNKNRPVKRKYPQEEDEMYAEDYEEDYDEEMDDFIDDGPAEEHSGGKGGYSDYIREIFGYDKRKYRYERDDDVDNMETSFAGQMKEEARSARLGREEDLDDIMLEKKMMMEMAKKKKKR